MIGIGALGVLALAVAFHLLARRRALRLAAARLHSRPVYHGLHAALWVLLAGGGVLLLLAALWGPLIERAMMAAILDARPDIAPIEAELLLQDAKALARGGLASREGELRTAIAARFAALEVWRLWGILGLSLAAGLAAGAASLARVTPQFRARNRAERILRFLLLAMAAIAVLTTIGIVLSLIFETLGFLSRIGWRVDKFLFGTVWSPLSGVQAGVIDADRAGALPLFAGTFLITLIAMLVAVPVGLFAAIYLSEFATSRTRALVKPMLEILAGIPTVVYGFFAALTVAPLLRRAGEALGLPIASESALAAGLVMGIMIIPFISSLSDDVINSVPQTLRDGSYALGATRAETIRQVVLPAALPGIVSAVLLGISRAVGETMIVVMAAGQGANLTLNPFEAVTTVTVQIVMLITGDTEADTAAGPAFTLGFTLFCLTLLMNVIALHIVRRYRELYD